VDLTDEEIGQVMDAEEPPYSLARIPKIIGRPVGLSPVNASTAIGKSGFADRD
jgi:hypothetical protein